MTISWQLRAENAEKLAKASREAAVMFPMRTHRRKQAFQMAQYLEREAAWFRSKVTGT